MELEDLVHLWRHFNSDQFKYTWFRKNPSPIMECLDYLLISEALLMNIEEVDIAPSFKSGHSIPWLVLAKTIDSRGPGFWKFNTSLLNDENYINFIQDLVDQELQQDHESIKQKYEMIKLEKRGATIQYSTMKKRECDEKLLMLQMKANLLESQMCQRAIEKLSVEQQHQEIVQVKKEIDKIVNYRMIGAVVRSRANWLHYGEKNSKYYFDLEKHQTK